MSNPPVPGQFSRTPRVYLAGPILGCNFSEANNWRKYVAGKLAPHNIVGVSPLRCEPIHGEIYTADYPDECFGTPRAIGAKNRFDVNTCDMGLYFVPKPNDGPSAFESFFDGFADTFAVSIANASPDRMRDVIRAAFIAGFDARRLHSFGTVGELFWANGGGKQTILVSDDPFIMGHPVIDAASNWKLKTFDDAIKVIVGVLGAYAGGKNV